MPEDPRAKERRKKKSSLKTCTFMASVLLALEVSECSGEMRHILIAGDGFWSDSKRSLMCRVPSNLFVQGMAA